MHGVKNYGRGTERLKLPIVEPDSPTNTPLYVVISILLIVAAAFFAGAGWYTVYNISYRDRILGGDNLIIYVTRGTALVYVGIVCAVLSVTFSVFAHMARKK